MVNFKSPCQLQGLFSGEVVRDSHFFAKNLIEIG